MVELQATSVMKDIQGIKRGECNKCECEEYRSPPLEKSCDGEGVRLRCEYCNHTPVEHVRIIALGACKQCSAGDDVCDQYESESPNKYTDCQYCGCGAQHHDGAEKLVKKVAAPQFSNPVPMGTAATATVRTDSLGNPVQTSQFGFCKFPGCKYPKRVENGHIHDFCSRTCSRKYDAASPANFSGGSPTSQDSSNIPSGAVLVQPCAACKTYPANPGHEWCQRCYVMAQAQSPKY